MNNTGNEKYIKKQQCQHCYLAKNKSKQQQKYLRSLKVAGSRKRGGRGGRGDRFCPRVSFVVFFTFCTIQATTLIKIKKVNFMKGTDQKYEKRDTPLCHKGLFKVKLPSVFICFIHLLICPGEDSETKAFKIKSSEFSLSPLFLKPMKLSAHCLTFLNKNLLVFVKKINDHNRKNRTTHFTQCPVYASNTSIIQ